MIATTMVATAKSRVRRAPEPVKAAGAGNAAGLGVSEVSELGIGVLGSVVGEAVGAGEGGRASVGKGVFNVPGEGDEVGSVVAVGSGETCITAAGSSFELGKDVVAPAKKRASVIAKMGASSILRAGRFTMIFPRLLRVLYGYRRLFNAIFR